ncbi:hypothetical protein GCM10019016_127540 [Streptomyces prasinosporus]|uniref:Uncharacterized protein n=1 Tax=Streptomyces prasinosporus TaxID=68256 RepID=A0ABP6UD09_9ACTN
MPAMPESANRTVGPAAPVAPTGTVPLAHAEPGALAPYIDAGHGISADLPAPLASWRAGPAARRPNSAEPPPLSGTTREARQTRGAAFWTDHVSPQR